MGDGGAVDGVKYIVFPEFEGLLLGFFQVKAHEIYGVSAEGYFGEHKVPAGQVIGGNILCELLSGQKFLGELAEPCAGLSHLDGPWRFEQDLRNFRGLLRALQE